MNEYRRRLERTQITLCVLLILLLFFGLLILPRIGQVVWIAIIAAIYVRVTLVIARREELLEEQSVARGSAHAGCSDAPRPLSTRRVRILVLASGVSRAVRTRARSPKKQHDGSH
jgi:hypothetical protein